MAERKRITVKAIVAITASTMLPQDRDQIDATGPPDQLRPSQYRISEGDVSDLRMAGWFVDACDGVSKASPDAVLNRGV